MQRFLLFLKIANCCAGNKRLDVAPKKSGTIDCFFFDWEEGAIDRDRTKAACCGLRLEVSQ